MKRLKLGLVFIIVMIGAVFVFGANKAYAAGSLATDSNGLATVGDQPQRPYSDDGFGNTNTDPYTTYILNKDNGGPTMVKLFAAGNGTASGVTPTISDYQNAIYCLRGSLGFGASGNNTNTTLKYQYVGDMFANKSAAAAGQTMSVYDRYNAISGISDANYNAILWIMNQMYVPQNVLGAKASDGSNDAQDLRNQLLAAAGISTSSDLTIDDIEIAQQAAIWYFSNYDTHGAADSVSLADTTALSNALTINNGVKLTDSNATKPRAADIDALYTYLVTEAKANSSAVPAITAPTVALDKTTVPTITATKISSLDYYIVGPFKITETNPDNVNITIDSTMTYNGSLSIPGIDNSTGNVFICDADGNTTRDKEIQDMLNAGEFYIAVNGLNYPNITSFNLQVRYKYWDVTKADFYVSDEDMKNAPPYTDQPLLVVNKEEKSATDSIGTAGPKRYDLALRKFITAVNGTELAGDSSRVPQIDLSKLNTTVGMNEITTATYTHSKTPISVKTGDKVTYTIRIYNEGDFDGKATSVADYLPAGLELVPSTPGDGSINDTYGWVKDTSYTDPGGNYTKITTDYLQNTAIKAYDAAKTSAGSDTNWQQDKAGDGNTGLYYADVQVECYVTATNTSASDKNLINIAEIAADDSDACGVTDRDSTPDNVDVDNYNPPKYPADNSTYQQDDDDYEPLVLPGITFDLSLQKWITSVNGTAATPDRTPTVDVSKLNTYDAATGNKITTAAYTHPQDAVKVKQGDIVTFTIRVYNEGDLDGYASTINDYIPVGLGFLPDYKTNVDNNWALGTGAQPLDPNGTDLSANSNLNASDFTGAGFTSLKSVNVIPGTATNTNPGTGDTVTPGTSTISTDMLKYDSLDPSDNLLKAYDAAKTSAGTDTNWQASTGTDGTGLYYRDVQVTCIVLAPNTEPNIITNWAEIAATQDETGTDNSADDRDSTPDNNKKSEDDIDHDQVKLTYFDLALKKFIASVTTPGGVTTTVNRVPTVTIPSGFPNTTTELTYTFPVKNGNKADEPVGVATNDTVVYTLRIYNEGTEAGYANEIKDDIPAGLQFDPANSTNQKYGWQMYYTDADGKPVLTTDATKATEIRTTYLSQASGTQNELQPFKAAQPISDATPLNPDYRDVQIAFKVTAKAESNNTHNIIINTAEITKESEDDIDSTPDNNKAGEDDIDYDYIYVKYFDLALIKYVSQTIVTVNGKTTTSQYPMPSDDPGSSYLVKVDIGKANIKQTTVKFVYTLLVTNDSEIAGSATEITDTIPEGLEFVQSDNPQWKSAGGNVVTTNALDGVILQPGESTTVPITLTWIPSGTNTGTKDNVAVITGFYNEPGSPDGNPNNNQDNALVILTLKTGGAIIYVPMTAAVLLILACGVFLIKRYVI